MSSQENAVKHVAIIMDGNGRWAEKRKLPRVMGHKAGAKVAKNIVRACPDLGVEVVTLFAFGVENWSRPLTEVKFLMTIILENIKKNINELHEQGVRFRVLGDRSVLNERLREQIAAAEKLTESNQRLCLNVAINYSGRWDLAHATKQIAEKVQAGILSAESIDPDCLAEHVELADLPEPDMLIRTSGEQRISNFMLWQLAYAELFFTTTPWPDFTVEEFQSMIAAFHQRQRRFGKTGKQIEDAHHA